MQAQDARRCDPSSFPPLSKGRAAAIRRSAALAQTGRTIPISPWRQALGSGLAVHPLVARLAVAGLARAGTACIASADPRCDLLAIAEAELVVFKLADLVAQAAGFLEFQIGGGVAHAFFEVLDIGAQIVADEVVALVIAGVDGDAVLAGGMRDDVGDVALDRGGRDAVLDVVVAAAFRGGGRFPPSRVPCCR